MGTLDDAIREHLDLKRRKGASEDELKEKEAEAFGRGGAAARPAPAEQAPDEPAAAADPPDSPPAEPRAWESDPVEEDLLEPDEVLPEDSLEPNGSMPPRKGETGPSTEELELESDEVAELEAEAPPPRWEDEPEDELAADDLLEETPDFLEETPEHDRLWFEQKPPKDFDFD
jgi:hypothetical protein